MSPYHGSGWWVLCAYVGAILGGITLTFLGLIQCVFELQINELVCSISGGIILAFSLLLVIDWIEHKFKLSKIDKLPWWNEPSLGFMSFGLVIFVFRTVSTIISYFIPFSSAVLSGVLGFLFTILLIFCGFILPYMLGKKHKGDRET